MGFKEQLINISTAIDNVLAGMTDYFTVIKEGMTQPIDEFPCVFYWPGGEIPHGNDYLDGDLIKMEYTIAAYDYDPGEGEEPEEPYYDTYLEAEQRSRAMAADLADEFGKWEHRHLSKAVAQSQVIRTVIDPGEAPKAMGGGMMAAGGIKLLVVFRKQRAA